VLLPLVSDEHWFFDTELLIAAERNGFRIHEVPVDWIDDSDSRVNIRSVAQGDLRGIARLMKNRASGPGNLGSDKTGKHRRNSGQNARYAEVGVLSTIAYLAVFLALRQGLGIYGANVAAFALSTVGNTIGHVRFTFGPKSGMRMHQAAIVGCLAFTTGILFTSLALGVGEILGTTSAPIEALAIVLGTVAAGFVRLILLRACAYKFHIKRVRSLLKV
jgi:putative flippase GtrA